MYGGRDTLRTAAITIAVILLAAGAVAQRKPAAVTGKLSSFYTRFNPGNAKRTHNIRVALKSLNRLVIKPGAVFSLNQRLGKRTQARGYRTAIVFEEGKKVPGIGGGVSQVAGTLFNAALLAGLAVPEYHSHSRPVPYLPVGRDATLAYGEKDLKIKNTSGSPVRLSYRIRGNRLTATFYGAKIPGRQVRLGVGVKRIAKNHIVARLYRKIKQNGKIVRTEMLGTSNYKWEPEAP